MKLTGDEKRGYEDRKAGYYDEWYRYNRKDDGAAYDRGVVRAINSGKCPEHFTLIKAIRHPWDFACKGKELKQ